MLNNSAFNVLISLSLVLTTSNEKVYICQFNSDLFQKHVWLIRCDKRNSLFCIPSLLYGGDAAWTQIGVRDLHHIHTKIKKHKTSVKHVNNVIDFSFLVSVDIAQRLDTGHQLMTARHNEKVTQNRIILSKIIDCIKVCGKYELSLRGHDESNA